MVRAIFRRWPYLQQIFNNDHDTNELFRFRLRMYFKNAQKKMSDVIPEVLSKRAIFGKRKSDSDDLPHATVTRDAMAWGVENYLPSLKDGEDQNTITAHRVRLASQFNHKKFNEFDISPQATVAYTRYVYNTRDR